MPAVTTFNNTIQNILEELEKLPTLEQKEVLAQLRAARIAREPRKSFVKPEKGIKPLTLAQIDKLKHEVRKKYAGK